MPVTMSPGTTVHVELHGQLVELAPHDGTGEVAWLGIRWGGTPAPRRWWARITRRPIPIVPGCGCIIALRTAWERVRTLATP